QSTLKSGCRGYQDINRLAMQLVSDGGRLLTFSCSGLMHSDLFQKIVSDAALEANVEARIIGTLRQDKDHVVQSACPESFYLRGGGLVIYKK
ncbi:23S rRNA (cytosine(1962)-C(5))-methyltransferase RlmI, partial [Enterobacter cloacae]|nr:23S rRNA (cytosine(1962)-C(5))-methyltransferase RlmI [Enterobacter cloacae]